MQEDLQVLLKNNTLIKAKYDLSTLENKIVNTVLFKVQKHPDNLVAIFKAQEIKAMTKNTAIHSSTEIKKILDRLTDNKISQINLGKWTYTSIIAGYTYHDKTDTFEIGLSPLFLRLVSSYKEKGFSSLSVTKYAQLTKPSGQRIYELLRINTVNNHVKAESDGTKKVTYKTQELREYLGLENSYERIYDFKRRIIEPAIKDINKKGLMDIQNVVYNKIGKNIESLTFVVKDLEPPTYNFKKIDIDKKDYKVDEDNYDENDNSELGILALQVNLSIKTIEKLYKEYGYQELKTGCEILSNTKKVTASLKYLKGILNNRKEQNKAKTHQQLGLDTGMDMNSYDGIIGWDE